MDDEAFADMLSSIKKLSPEGLDMLFEGLMNHLPKSQLIRLLSLLHDHYIAQGGTDENLLADIRQRLTAYEGSDVTGGANREI